MNQTTIVYEQGPLCNGYYILSELNDVLRSSYYDSPLGYDTVDWLVGEKKMLETKMTFFKTLIKILHQLKKMENTI